MFGDLKEKMDRIALPPGYRYTMGGSSKDIQESLSYAGQALLLALLVYGWGHLLAAVVRWDAFSSLALALPPMTGAVTSGTTAEPVLSYTREFSVGRIASTCSRW